jgi:hypothetical protein
MWGSTKPPADSIFSCFARSRMLLSRVGQKKAGKEIIYEK